MACCSCFLTIHYAKTKESIWKCELNQELKEFIMVKVSFNASFIVLMGEIYERGFLEIFAPISKNGKCILTSLG